VAEPFSQLRGSMPSARWTIAGEKKHPPDQYYSLGKTQVGDPRVNQLKGAQKGLSWRVSCGSSHDHENAF